MDEGIEGSNGSNKTSYSWKEPKIDINHVHLALKLDAKNTTMLAHHKKMNGCAILDGGLVLNVIFTPLYKELNLDILELF